MQENSVLVAFCWPQTRQLLQHYADRECMDGGDAGGPPL